MELKTCSSGVVTTNTPSPNFLQADALPAYKLLDKKLAQYVPVPCKLTFDLLTLKVVSESRVTILVFLGLSVLDLGWMYETDIRRASSLNAPTLGAGHNIL